MDNLYFNICSLNARGLRNKIKRKTILKELKAKNMHVVALQETYLSKEFFEKIKKRISWNNTFLFMYW